MPVTITLTRKLAASAVSVSVTVATKTVRPMLAGLNLSPSSVATAVSSTAKEILSSEELAMIPASVAALSILRIIGFCAQASIGNRFLMITLTSSVKSPK